MSGIARKRSQLFDRLMRRSVFAQADRIVREDVNYRHLHEGCQANRRAHVVAEIEERAAEGPQLRDRHAIQRGTHGMFANAEMNIAPAVLVWTGSLPRLKFRVVLLELPRSAEPPISQGIFCASSIQNLAGTLAGRHTFRIGGKRTADSCPSRREFAMLHASIDRRVRDIVFA